MKRKQKQTEKEDADGLTVQAICLTDPSEPWHKAFAPTSLNELAVDERRQNEIRIWMNRLFSESEMELTDAFSDPNQTVSRVALITGPAGSGKTTTVKMVAQSLGIYLFEYTDPENLEIESDQQDRDEDDNEAISLTPFNQTRTQHFETFLLERCRSTNEFRSVILIENIPNVFIRKAYSLHKVLKKLIRLFPQHTPVVFMMTTVLTRSDEFRVFPNSITSELNITRISFNPVSRTLMNKALKRLHVYQLADAKEWDEIAESSAGDLRIAFNEAEMRFSHWEPESHLSDAKRIKTEKLSQRQLIRSSFHWLGKVLYPKRLLESDLTLKQDEISKRHFPLVTSPELIVNERTCSGSKLILNLHQNYVKRTTSIEQVARCSEHLSLAERISVTDFTASGNIFDDYMAEVSIRGLLYHLPPTFVNWKGEIVFKDGVKSDNSGTRNHHQPGLLLQETPVFYAYDSYCRSMRSLAAATLKQTDQIPLPQTHLTNDVFADIIPFFQQQCAITSPQTSAYRRMADQMTQMANDLKKKISKSTDEKIDEDNDLTPESNSSVSTQSDCFKKGNFVRHSHIRGMEQDEDSDEYEIMD